MIGVGWGGGDIYLRQNLPRGQWRFSSRASQRALQLREGLGTTSHYELTHASRCPACKAIYFSRCINTWRHSSTFKLTVILHSDPNGEPDGPHVRRRCAEARPPPLSCQGVLAPPNGSNYTTDTYNCVLSLLTHHMNQCRAHPVPPVSGGNKKKSKHAVLHESCSFSAAVCRVERASNSRVRSSQEF